MLAPGERPLSPAARAFNLQLTRVDKLRAQLDELDGLGQAHRAALHRETGPLQARHRERQRELVLRLDAALQGKTLGHLQQETAAALLCGMAEILAGHGDAEMAALHDRHSRQTLAQKRLAEREALARMRASWEAGQTRREDKAAARKARRKTGVDSAPAQQVDAEAQLRRLFRQLASALHPDREPDAQERLRKTALMSEANAAHGRKDLVTLMQIQLRAELADPAAVSGLADDRLGALTLLLKQQVAGLERERAARQERLAAEFGLPVGQVAHPDTLRQWLSVQVAGLQSAVAQLEQDLVQVGDAAGLKRWLNRQRDTLHPAPADRKPGDYA